MRRKDTEEVVELIPALRAFARTFYRDQTDADDLVQETLTKAIAKIDQYQHGTRLKSWLFTIMRNTFYNRVVVHSREAPGQVDCVASQPATAATQEWAVRGCELEQAISRLPEKQRQILVLITIEGATYLEAADRCGCDIGTVKSRLFRSRARLLKELGADNVQSALN
ncbi:MAG: sigma-70 family RNA polymerase sigma factor [Rhizobiaceae bacterium]|nr:sigma-70 family RNA polymerase sigma factor [Rhizobiaceae bacterium]MCV0407467.1 sigma-70 family RNA polymerase sigma factor [Rhizobiaceae bacterium]